ncbi:hypothetical protein N0V91_009456 [Didymella pomorum]|uniref:Beta-xylosidase C-terminal Concanavalin A-like domain-containing protein n=1 Tax=Didymella pomorum TaxID=749634 RepID=A0A9W9D4E8_9PLEO|nr:hypothetical protein N0V91_009456 [Didymella pomorum]
MKTRLSVILANAALTVAKMSHMSQMRHNPALPGWHSDPSCVFVAEWDNTTFCTTSTFLLTPGLPVYGTKDNINFQLASHALSRKAQYPKFDQSLTMNDGIWAPTIRYHQGVFYIITIYRNNVLEVGKSQGLIFESKDPYSNDAWSDPVQYNAEYIDPDLFWDDDGTAYVASAGTFIQTVDLKTGTFGKARSIWNGTGNGFAEGPHIYKKDGYYYLLSAEGGSGMNHSVVMARSKAILGPYENFPKNPILTNRGSGEYFQNIGHADLFHDVSGRWWATTLTWRSGPKGKNYPMGREMTLTPVNWVFGDWPVIEPVRGLQNGWCLAASRDMPGDGPFVDEHDDVEFPPNSSIPKHFGFWRWPERGAYTISPPGHPGTLELKPSAASIIAGYKNYTAGYEVANFTLITRRQTDTLFQFSVDVSFTPELQNEETGVTVFLNQVQNISLGIVMLPRGTSNGSDTTTNSTLAPHLRFIVSGLGSEEKNVTGNIPAPNVTIVPDNWLTSAIRLIIRAESETHYALYAASSAAPWDVLDMGRAPATIVSGGDGPFTGKSATQASDPFN